MKTIERGEVIPVGLSEWRQLGAHGYQLRLPIFIWHGKFYDIRWDGLRTGWKALNILFRTECHGLNFRWWWELVKETGEMVPYPRG